ncbi:hypothetical protein J6590_101646, partial [Homalodisca vitripennis]
MNRNTAQFNDTGSQTIQSVFKTLEHRRYSLCSRHWSTDDTVCVQDTGAQTIQSVFKTLEHRRYSLYSLNCKLADP